jgi:hypothetical protein
MGPTIVTVFGAGLALAALGRFLWKADDRRAKGQMLGAVLLIALALGGLAVFGLQRTTHGEREHDHHAHEELKDHEEHGDEAPTPAEPRGDDDLDALIDDAEEEAGD